jgi:hypothetical protein
MKIEKFKKQATLRITTGGTLDVNFFLSYSDDTHPGGEIVLDILNSEVTFFPLEDILANEIILIGKSQFMDVQLLERDMRPETLASSEIPVVVELINGDVLEGSFFTEMPPDRLRLSDYLNFTSQFVYLCRDQDDIMLNKDYILSVKHK